MPGDPLAGLFKRRLEIDVPGGAAETHARKLAQQGLIRVQESSYVRCVNPLDSDQWHLKDVTCPGRIYISRDRDESDGEYQCPDCGREVYPSRKQQRSSIRVIPDEDAMRRFVRERIAEVSTHVEERPAGLYCISTPAGEVRVCLVDFCKDPVVFSESYSYRDSLMFVVGNDRDYLRRLPAGIPAFRLAELVLGQALSNFHRTLRGLMGRRLNAPAPFGPTVPVPPPLMALALTPAPRRARLQRRLIRINVPPGTRWNEIKLYLVDGETLALHAPGKKLERYHHYELGMVHKRTGKPSKKWGLMEELCNGHGCIPWTGTVKQFSAFKEQVSSLRWILQEVFGIKSDPFRECSRRSGLHAAFQAFPDLPAAGAEPPPRW